MKRQSTGSRHLIPQPRPAKQFTLQQLLDRESRQKTIQLRKLRENVIPQLKVDQKKEQGDKNMRINNLQKQFEELKNKIKHVENKNERILTKLKSFKDDSREKSRGRASSSINKDQLSQQSHHQIITSNIPLVPQRSNNAVSIGREEKPDTRDPYFINYPRKQSNHSSQYNLLINENTSLKENVQFLKMQVDKYERSMVSRNQMYEEKEAFYKQMMNNKDQQIAKLKQPKNRADLRKLVEYINTNERLNSQTRFMLEKRVKELDERLGRALKLIRLCERTIKEQRGSKSLRHNKSHNQKDNLQFFNLKEKQLENIIDELEKDQKRLRNQNSDATKQVEEAHAKLDSLKDTHQEELKELRSKYTARMSAIEKKYTDQIKLNTEEINQLKIERDDAIEQLTDEKLLLTKIKKQLAQNEQKLKKNQTKLNLQFENLNNETVILKENLSRVEQERDSLQFEIDRLYVGKSMKDSDLMSTDHNEKLELGNQIKTLRLKVETLELQLANLKRQNWQVNLKLKKKEEFKIQLQQIYKEKLQEETKGTTIARQEKRKAQLQLNQLKTQISNEAVQQERIAQEIVQEIEMMAALQGEGESTYKSLLDIYKDYPSDLPLQIIRIAADNKRMEVQDKQRITKLIENKKLQFIGNRRFEIQAVQQLVQMVGSLTTELRMKEQVSQQVETKGRWEKQLLQQEVSKLKKSNEQLKRQRDKDEMEKKHRKSEVAHVKQSMEEQQKERYAELRNIVLKAETEKKQLQKRLKMTQFQMDEFKETTEEQLRRKERSEADKEHMVDELHQRVIEKEERLREYEAQVRDLKQDSLKKKRDYMSELRKIEYDLNEKLNKLEMEIDEKNSQLLYKDEQIITLTAENGSLSASLTAQKTKLNKQLTQNEKTLRDSITKKDQEVRSKSSEITQLTGTHQELMRKYAQLQNQLRQKQNQQEIIKQSLEREKEKSVNLQRTRTNEKAEYEQKLKLKKQNQDLLTKRLQLIDSESTHYNQQIRDLKQQLKEIPVIKQDYEKLQDKLIQKQSHLIEYQQKIRSIQDQNKNLTEKLTKQNQSNSLKLMKLQGHVKSIEDQLTTSEQQNQKLKGNLHQKQTDLSRTLRQFEASQQQLKDKEGQLEQLRSLNEKAAGSNEGLRKQAQQYSAMLKTVEQKQIEINDLRKKIEQLITDNSQLEQKLRVANEVMLKLQNKLVKHEAALQSAIERQKTTYQQRLQDQKKSSQKQYAKLIESHTTQKDELTEEYTRTQIELKSKMVQLEDTIKTLNKQIKLSIAKTNIQTNHQQCQEQLRVFKAQLQKLKQQKAQASSLTATLQLANRQLKQQLSHKHLTQSDILVQPYSIPIFDNAVDRTEPDTANFFSIGEDEPVTKKKQQHAMMGFQLKEFLTRIRIEIEKVLNQEEISVQIFEILPGQLADEFQQLINAVHRRIIELNEKAHQQDLSFIYIDQQEEVYFGDSLIGEFPQLGTVTTDPQELLELKSKVSEQQRMIHNLTSEKEQHENTVQILIKQINQLTQQKQQAEEQNEARFITQLGVLKKQLKEFKDRIDSLDMLLSATKKTLFKILEIAFSDNLKLQEDLAESINYYMSMVKLQDKEKQLLNTYFQKYSQRSKSATKRSWFS